jgi:hypothetical protein
MIKIVAFSLALTLTGATKSYTSAKVGEWVPPNPPSTETLHLKHLSLQPGEKLPAPTMSLESETAFIEVAASASEAAVEPQRVPHNWYVHVC